MLCADNNTHYARRQRRRGVGTLLFVVFLVIFVMLAALVINYTYLAYSQLRMGDVTDTLARTAATRLLDETLLDETPTFTPNDNIAGAEEDVALYLTRLNATAGANQQLRYLIGSTDEQDTDILVTAGRVENVNESVTDSGATPTFAANVGPTETYNTLKVEASRQRTGGNPLYQFIRGQFGPETADIGTASFATLDSRVLGFRPTLSLRTPIVPLAIAAGAWDIRSAQGGIVSREDFVGRLESDGSGNLLLLNFDQGDAVDVNEIVNQIYDGTDASQIDVAGSDYLGPIAEGVVTQVFNGAANAPVMSGEALADAFNDIVGERRIFPLYSSFNGSEAEVTGFVSATILAASWDNVNEDLELILEPEFVVHHTGVTAYGFDHDDDALTPPVVVPENVYVHKLRLSR